VDGAFGLLLRSPQYAPLLEGATDAEFLAMTATKGLQCARTIRESAVVREPEHLRKAMY